MAFSRSLIETTSDGITLGLRQESHRHALGQVLSNETIRVLIRSSFPRMVRCGEVER